VARADRIVACNPPRTGVYGPQRGLEVKLTRICGRLGLVGVLCAVAACGDDGGGSSPPPATFNGTLAYVVTECHEKAPENRFHQALRIQHDAEAAPITVTEFDIGPVPARLGCPGLGLYRWGALTVSVGVFQRLGVSPDGSTVVFEITDDFSLLHRPQWGGIGSLVPEEKKGFFSVHTDGSGLRRLGPASREATFRVAQDRTAPSGYGGWLPPAYSIFSPDGRRITFTDRDSENAIQIFVMDVGSGERMQLTSLPPLTPISLYTPPVFPGFFLDNDTIQFSKFAAEEIAAYTVKVNDKDKKLTKLEPIANGGVFDPIFQITSPAEGAFAIGFSDRKPDNQLPHLESVVNELFVASGANLPQQSGGPLLQLTSFNRSDTGLYGGVLSPDRQRVLFMASADPFGRNPYENCQIFSIDTLGTNLRQLTDFNEGAHSLGGCAYAYPPGCTSILLGADAATDSVLFHSNCDPLRTNPYGGQFFAMHFDGSGLRQLSAFKGMVVEGGGTVRVELPGPIAILPLTE